MGIVTSLRHSHSIDQANLLRICLRQVTTDLAAEQLIGANCATGDSAGTGLGYIAKTALPFKRV